MYNYLKFMLWFWGIVSMIFTALLAVAPEMASMLTFEHEVLRIIGLVIFGILIAKKIIPLIPEK